MRFEIAGLVGDHRIGRGVGFIESIAGKVGHEIEQFLRFPLREMGLLCALNEQCLLFFHLLRLLLPHRAPEEIGLPQRKPSQPIRDRHDLLLIDDHSTGVLQDGLQGRWIIGDMGRIPFALDEVVHHPALQRAGTVEGQNGNEILESFGLDLHQQIAHPGAFQLEDPTGAP